MVGELKAILARRILKGVAGVQLKRVGGGCINDCFKVEGGKHDYFCKVNSATKFPQLLLKEKDGLELLKKQNVIGVPNVADCFEESGMQILVLEWVDEGARNEEFWKRFGEQLATLHSVHYTLFGLSENNYMGSVPQCNSMNTNWAHFFIDQRLRPLIEECIHHNLLTTKHIAQFEKLYNRIPEVFDDGQKPSLQHGDLWSGNFMCNAQSLPVLIDPAAYYGHPSIDLGMTTLFGGFHPLFYESYHYHRPFPANYKEQWKVCNLYPLLIHLILFGRSYLLQIEEILESA